MRECSLFLSTHATFEEVLLVCFGAASLAAYKTALLQPRAQREA